MGSPTLGRESPETARVEHRAWATANIYIWMSYLDKAKPQVILEYAALLATAKTAGWCATVMLWLVHGKEIVEGNF